MLWSYYGFSNLTLFFMSKTSNDAELKNGEFRFIDESVSDEQYAAYSEIFRLDLLAEKVPHWKPIGVKVNTANAPTSALVTIEGTYTSYIKLSIESNNIILANPISVDGSATVMLQGGAQEAVGEFNPQLISRATRLIYPNEPQHPVDNLIKGVTIAAIEPTKTISFYLARSIGVMDFKETSDRIKGLSGYWPVRAIYDLNDIISVRKYKPGDGCIKFTYKKDISEMALKDIIIGWYNDRYNAQIEFK